MFRMKLLADSKLLAIVDDVLGPDPGARAAARTLLWLQVQLYVLSVANLQLGPWNDDPDVRRDIFVAVMHTLEANNFARLGAWRARRLTDTDKSSFWGLVRVTTRHRSIDHGRAHPRNIARRGEPFRWVREETAPPHVLDRSVSATPVLAHSTADQLRAYMARFQHALSSAVEPTSASADPPPLPVPDLVLPDGSGKRRR
jgi:hypothetical protein